MKRFDAAELTRFACSALESAGLPVDAATDVAQVLVEGDLLGHDTHGLALLSGYVGALVDGSMTATGRPTVVSERSAVCVWDGRRMAGPHLVREALRWAMPRAREHGLASVAIRRSHHIACLAAYLEAPARDGLMVELVCSDPSTASVAPFGGTEAVITPNPIAYGIPTSVDPIIIDVSASITTNGMTNRLAGGGERGAHAWWLTPDGLPTNDPSVLALKPAGTLLPLGGVDAGHKGYGLGLQVEAATAALAGHGRADPSEGWGATVYLQVTDPQAFAGLGEFNRQTDWLRDACRANKPRDPARPVRLPGERGLARKRDQLAGGIELHPSILPALAELGRRFGLTPPAPR